MNAPHHPSGTVFLVASLFVLNAIAQAQENPPPAPAAAPAEAPAQTEMQKWIATTDAQWQAVFKRDVTDVHEAEAKKLMLQYLTSLEEGIAKASKASDLNGALALRNEQKRFGDTQLFPEQDDAADAVSVKQIRAAIRAQLPKVENDNAVRIKALHAKYDQVLAQVQAQLTQKQRLDDALLVKNKRDEVTAAWITPAVAAAVEKINPSQSTVQKPPSPANLPFGVHMAKVHAENIQIVPLIVGEAVTAPSSKNAVWTRIPDEFRGYKFTRSEKLSVPLNFRIESPGLVYLACTSDFGLSAASGPWRKTLTPEKELLKNGWKKQDELTLKDTNVPAKRAEWWVYSRQCKAGEKFSYRTGKDEPPILLVK